MDAALWNSLAEVRYNQGELPGKMKSLGFQFREEANVFNITLDIVKSNEIKGEILKPQYDRSSVARRLRIETAGIGHADQNMEGWLK